MSDSTISEIQHPVITHKIDLLRESTIKPWEFRRIIHELSVLLVYEALADTALRSVESTIWSGPYTRRKIGSGELAFVSILRAGVGMTEGALDVFPKAPVCFVGVNRDEASAKPQFYYKNVIPDIAQRTAVIIDPMLATGGSADYTISLLKNEGCRRIKLVSVISAPEGIAFLKQRHQDVSIFTGVIDQKLNDRFFIIPGLGDAGDRCFNTVTT